MSCVGDSLAFLREQNGRISALGKIPKCPSLKNPPSPRPHPRPPDQRAHCDSVPVPPCGLRPRARRRPGSRRPHRRVHLERPKCRSPWPLHSSIRIPQITWRFINPSASLQSSWHPNPVKCHPIWQAEELSVQQGSLLQPCSLAGSPPKPYIIFEPNNFYDPKTLPRVQKSPKISVPKPGWPITPLSRSSLWANSAGMLSTTYTNTMRWYYQSLDYHFLVT